MKLLFLNSLSQCTYVLSVALPSCNMERVTVERVTVERVSIYNLCCSIYRDKFNDGIHVICRCPDGSELLA